MGDIVFVNQQFSDMQDIKFYTDNNKEQMTMIREGNLLCRR